MLLPRPRVKWSNVLSDTDIGRFPVQHSRNQHGCPTARLDTIASGIIGIQTEAMAFRPPIHPAAARF